MFVGATFAVFTRLIYSCSDMPIFQITLHGSCCLALNRATVRGGGAGGFEPLLMTNDHFAKATLTFLRIRVNSNLFNGVSRRIPRAHNAPFGTAALFEGGRRYGGEPTPKSGSKCDPKRLSDAPPPTVARLL